MKRILILGVNGFIGHHLSKRVLATTDWEVYGMDMQSDRIEDLAGERRFRFFEGDITINKEWIEYHIRKCDTVLPLVAIATPAVYVKDPLRVFELDFEANLPIVRAAVRHGKRLVFPSTSEVYGMSPDREFDPENSPLVYGPINRQRWIYACSKQLMDRVIWAYGEQQGLDFTLFRPFNWIGSGLDSINTAKEGSSRVVTQFLGHLLREEPITLVDGGSQRRCFTHIDDGIDAMMRILKNENGCADAGIFNIGNPKNDRSIRELAETMVRLLAECKGYERLARNARIVEQSADKYYGGQYQDVVRRVPSIARAGEKLGWTPKIGFDEAVRRTIGSYTDTATLPDTSKGWTGRR
jgi:nucleoside-diphosphate-sugar epimerase